MKASINNIEKHIELFDNNNNVFNDFTWAEPIFVAMIRAYQNDNKIDIQTNNTYIKQMISSEHEANKSFSPIENIESRAGLETISKHIGDIMLKNFTDLSPVDTKDLKEYLQYLFLELMNNVADHSHSPVGGYTMAQYFPTNKKVQFVVVDRGVGFLENMLLYYKNIANEEKAIKAALEKGITSTRAKMYGQERNAGYGLFAMFEILKMTGGKFVIISNDTLVRYYNKRFTAKKLSVAWKGVVVAFEFKEANINHDMDYFMKNYLWSEILGVEDEDFY